MLQLLRQVLYEVVKRLRTRLPVMLFLYNIFDLSGGVMQGLDAPTSGSVGPRLFLYEPEVVHAFDRERRVRLITDLIRDIHQADQKKAAKQAAQQNTADNGLPTAEPVPEAASTAEEAAVKKRPHVGAYAYWQQMMR